MLLRRTFRDISDKVGVGKAMPLPLARFRDDEDGSIVVFSVFVFFTMLVIAGLSVDFMRYEMARTRMQNTMDNAVLAAASLKQTQTPDEVVRDYFEAAGLDQYIEKLGYLDDPEAKEEGEESSEEDARQLNYRKVWVMAGAKVNPIFLQFSGIGQMPMLASSIAEEGINEVEISLVLDVSGSMGDPSSKPGVTKLEALQEAAKDFAYSMQCDMATTRDNPAAECEVEYGKVSISVIPYAEQVTAGPVLLGEYHTTDEHSYSHCVDFSATDYEEVGLSSSSTSKLKRTGHFDPWLTGQYSWWTRTTTYYSPRYWPCPTQSSRFIRPFMDDFNDIYTVVDDLTAQGNTSIDIGMKWATALVDPGTRGIITELTKKDVTGALIEEPEDGGEVTVESAVAPIFEGRPYDYDKSYNQKVIILMTDGMNTSQHYLLDAYREGPSEIYHYTKANGDPGDKVYSVYNDDNGKYTWVDENRNVYNQDTWNDVPYVGQVSCYTDRRGNRRCSNTGQYGTARQLDYTEVWDTFTTDWYRDFYFLNDPVLDHGNTEKNDRLDDICEAARKKKIAVYTIGFETPEGSDGETVLQKCATTPNYFYRANGVNISKTFNTIASSINQLRLTQ